MRCVQRQPDVSGWNETFVANSLADWTLDMCLELQDVNVVDYQNLKTHLKYSQGPISTTHLSLKQLAGVRPTRKQPTLQTVVGRGPINLSGLFELTGCITVDNGVYIKESSYKT